MKANHTMQRLESVAQAALSQQSRLARAPYILQQHRHSSTTDTRRRHLHTTSPKEDAALPLATAAAFSPTTAQTPPATYSNARAASALACLPLSQVLRTYLITTISSSPALLGSSSKLLRVMLESKNPLFSLDKNPVMRAILWETFYKQFCAGENKTQVAKVCTDLRGQAYAGVILEYALEVLKDAQGDEVKDVETWRQGVLETIRIAAEGDFVGLKWSGMGAAAMRLMGKTEPPTKLMDNAMREVCDAAAKKDVSLLPAAEETWTLNGFHEWCLNLQRVYNMNGKSVVYSTYQAYLHQTPATLSKHLQIAKEDKFALGVKLVRGAYLGSEKRDLIHSTIEGTHAAYDSVASALIHRQHNDIVKPVAAGAESWPDTNVVLATHNMVSVQSAQRLRREQATRGEALTPLSFAQLQGMADEVSCSLIAAAKGIDSGVQERVYKCTTWGSMYQCLNYLLRRAAENKDAAGRTADTRQAMQAELGRRLRGVFGLA